MRGRGNGQSQVTQIQRQVLGLDGTATITLVKSATVHAWVLQVKLSQTHRHTAMGPYAILH